MIPTKTRPWLRSFSRTASTKGRLTKSKRRRRFPAVESLESRLLLTAPMLAKIEPTALMFTENGAASQITNAITVSDGDDVNLQSAKIRININYQIGADVLAVSGALPAGISIAGFNVATGVLTLSGSSSVANYQQALRQVTYQNTSDDPGAANRNVRFQVDDGGATGNLSNIVNRTIMVTPVNDAPALSGIEAGALSYTENGVTPITSTLAVSDVDSDTFAGATVAMTSGFISGQDRLAVSGALPAGITSGFSSSTGVLTLTGTASLADYEQALRQVTYQNNSDNPSTATRTVSFRVNDGGAVSNLSNIAARDISITPVNDPPRLIRMEPTPLNFTENGPPLQAPTRSRSASATTSTSRAPRSESTSVTRSARTC